MPAFLDLIDQRFGRLVVIARAHSIAGKTTWLCECDCGRKKIIRARCLRSGNTQSCGCLAEERHAFIIKHGESQTPLNAVWRQMRDRCHNPKCSIWHDYGGRGITICAAWDDFTVFRDWAVGHGYGSGLSIDRVDNDGPYTPENCRWVDQKTQNRNKRNNTVLTYRGKTACVMEHAEDAGLAYYNLHDRIFKLGWTVERAIETPVKGAQ